MESKNSYKHFFYFSSIPLVHSFLLLYFYIQFKIPYDELNLILSSGPLNFHHPNLTKNYTTIAIKKILNLWNSFTDAKPKHTFRDGRDILVEGWPMVGDRNAEYIINIFLIIIQIIHSIFYTSRHLGTQQLGLGWATVYRIR